MSVVKENQVQFYENIEVEFRFSNEIKTSQYIDCGHGRIETRKYSVISNFKHIENQDKWKKFKTIIRIESTTEFKNSDKPMEKAVRYYIASLNVKVTEFQDIIRSHWSIENKLHRTLDVAFIEDRSRKRDQNAS